MPWQKDSYSREELARMQAEAGSRAEKMWRSAAESAAAPTPPNCQKHSAETPPNPPQIFSVLSGIDGDKLLIIALILLLINEKSDPKLILALAWLII